MTITLLIVSASTGQVFPRIVTAWTPEVFATLGDWADMPWVTFRVSVALHYPI